jgi:hypothetical protein
MSTLPFRPLHGPSRLVIRQGTHALSRATSRSLAKNVKQHSVSGEARRLAFNSWMQHSLWQSESIPDWLRLHPRQTPWFTGTQWRRVELPRSNRARCLVSTMHVRRYSRTFFGGTLQQRSQRLDGATDTQLSIAVIYAMLLIQTLQLPRKRSAAGSILDDTQG